MDVVMAPDLASRCLPGPPISNSRWGEPGGAGRWTWRRHGRPGARWSEPSVGTWARPFVTLTFFFFAVMMCVCIQAQACRYLPLIPSYFLPRGPLFYPKHAQRLSESALPTTRLHHAHPTSTPQHTHPIPSTPPRHALAPTTCDSAARTCDGLCWRP